MASRCLADTLKPETPFSENSRTMSQPICAANSWHRCFYGDVILFDLLQRGNAIQAANSFSQGHASLRLERPNVAVLQNCSDGGHGIIRRKWCKGKMHMESIYLQRYHVLEAAIACPLSSVSDSFAKCSARSLTARRRPTTSLNSSSVRGVSP